MPMSKKEQENLIRVPIGPGGIFGYRMVTPRSLGREQARKERAAARRKPKGARDMLARIYLWVQLAILGTVVLAVVFLVTRHTPESPAHPGVQGHVTLTPSETVNP